MSEEHNYLLRGLCLLAGYLFGGFLTADVVAHCLAGVGVRRIGTGDPGARNIAKCLGGPAGMVVILGDAVKTALACWFCYRLAAPELEHAALLYGGIGAILGHSWPLWYKGRGGRAAVVACTWLILYLPITGALCCLAGVVAVAGTQRKGWGMVLAVLLAIPVAFLQFGLQSGLAVLSAGLLLLWQQRKELIPSKRNHPRSFGERHLSK